MRKHGKIRGEKEKNSNSNIRRSTERSKGPARKRGTGKEMINS